MYLRMLLKIDLRVQMYEKCGQLKVESMSESANGKTINAFEVPLMIQFKLHLIISLELHLKLNLHLKVHLSVQSTTPLRTHLKICLMVYFEIHIKMHKTCI